MLVEQTVQIREDKKVKYRERLTKWQGKEALSVADCEAVIGMLNHCAMVVPEGKMHLAGLYKFQAQFGRTQNTFVRLQPPGQARQDIVWWGGQLRQVFCGRSIHKIPLREDIQLFVDASSSWGIGLVVGERWCAWELAKGWQGKGRDISWAEMVAVELAVRWMVEAGFQG